MFKYRFDIIDKLKEKGYSTYKLRNDHLLSEKTLTEIRKGRVMFSEKTFEFLCSALEMQISDIVEHIPNEKKADSE